ncbi:MAG: PHP domain-containing protein [Candidatus Nitrosocaldus sp.]
MSNTDNEVAKQLEAADQAEKNYPGPKEFTHLHTHSIFSTLDGVATPEQYMERCAQVGMTSFALTDHGSLAGIPDAYWAAKKRKIKFIVGCEIYYNDYHTKMREWQAKDIKLNAIKAIDPDFVDRYRRNRHLTIVCKNMQGYRNLLALQKDGYEMGLYYNKPRTWFDQLVKYRDGLIVVSGCLNGPVCYELRLASDARDKGDNLGATQYYKKALDYVKRFREAFGDDFYLELQMPGDTIERAKEVFFQTSVIAKKLGIKAVMTGDVHYLHRRDFELQKTMMAVEQGVTVNDPNLFHVDSDEGFFKTRAQLRESFITQGYNKYDGIDWFEQVCDNTIEIANKCEGFMPDLSPKLPEIENADDIIQKLVAQALINKGLHKNDKKYLVDGRLVTYTEQAKIELARIIEKRFSSYFLITRQLVNFARDNGYDVGPARGSAGGSLVCFLLGIHDIDPLKWGLSFDRFLSPSRGGYMLKVDMQNE